MGSNCWIYRYCGLALPPVLTSSGRYMKVMFHANNSVARVGFEATYTALDALSSK